MSRIKGRLKTIGELLLYFLKPSRLVLLPLLIVLLLAGVLLLVSKGLAYVAPFVYTIF